MPIAIRQKNVIKNRVILKIKTITTKFTKRLQIANKMIFIELINQKKKKKKKKTEYFHTYNYIIKVQKMLY